MYGKVVVLFTLFAFALAAPKPGTIYNLGAATPIVEPPEDAPVVTSAYAAPALALSPSLASYSVSPLAYTSGLGYRAPFAPSYGLPYGRLASGYGLGYARTYGFGGYGYPALF